MDLRKPLRRAARLLTAHRKTTASADVAPDPVSLPSVEEALSPYQPLLRRIRAAYGYPDEAFEQQLAQPITALAAWVHRLPGHPGGGFERPGGALEQALTNCLFSLQAADGLTFDATPSGVASCDATQRWRLACALAGLFASLPQVLSRIEVAVEDGRLWPATGLPLVAWLRSLPATTYRYRWSKRASALDGVAAYAASRCIAPEVMGFLAAGGTEVTGVLMANIAGTAGTGDAISMMVAKIAAAVVAHQQLAADATPPTDHLTATLKCLFATSDWLPNAPGGHVWHARDGLYLLWPAAAAKLLEALPRHASSRSDPATADQLLQRLSEAEILDTKPSTLHHVRLPGRARPEFAVRLLEHRPFLPERSLRIAPLAGDIGTAGPKSAEERQPAREPSIATREAEVEKRTDPADAEHDEPMSNAAAPRRAQDDSDNMLATQSSHQPLGLDTSRVVNPRSRELIDDVVVRLDSAFDKMLAKTTQGGIFVALSEFIGDGGDAAPIVRALHDAGLLASRESGSRRISTERMEGADVTGIVLREEAFDGYASWTSRWQANETADHNDGIAPPSLTSREG
jgi:conjugal transfer pilus assembly protein TraI